MKSASDPAAFVLAVVAAAGLLACRDVQPVTECARCHMPEFTTTSRPPHAGARPTTCGVCHTQTSWHGWRVDHPTWPLTGAHARAAADKGLAGKEAQVKCFWCHRGDPSTYKDTKKECVACHAEDHEAAKSPDHAGFPVACERCHTTEAWKPATPHVASHTDAGTPAATVVPPTATATAAAPKPTAVPASPPRPTAIPTSPPRPPPLPTPPPPAPKPDVTAQASRRK